ncbi:MAG TPA: glycosyltransferase family 39 protein, partial [Myxococcales bacterium]|nr:glycosyltransferase family 39 protein [Myxococcales bacterium]
MSLLALLAIACAGAGLVEAGLPRRAGDLALRCALAFALGLGTWSAAYAAQWLAFGARGTAAKDLLLACAGAALFLAKRPARKSQTSSGKSQTLSDESQTSPAAASGAPRWLMGLFAAACALTALLFVEHTLRFPDGGWDAWMLWNLRARFLVRAADAAAAFSPQMLFWAHQDYPWLLPGVVAQVFLLRGESYAAPAAIAFLFGALLVALVALAVSRLYGRRAGLLAGLALCGMPCFVTFTANQQSDVPLALYLFAAAALLQLDAPLLAGFAAGLGIWTKNEGLVYALCLAAGLLALKRDKLVPFLLGALPGVALLAAFKLLAAPPSAFVGESAL